MCGGKLWGKNKIWEKMQGDKIWDVKWDERVNKRRENVSKESTRKKERSRKEKIHGERVCGDNIRRKYEERG